MIQNLVTRREWGAAPARGVPRLAPERVAFLVLHYSAMDADERPRHAECAARVRAIQRYHQTSDQLAPGGAADIAYNWLVCRHGYVFVGRGWRRRSAATGPANDCSVAVCFLGNDSAARDDVTSAGRRAIRDVLAFCERNAPNLRGVRGHRDFMSTSCPGDELYAFARRLTADLERRKNR